MNYKLYSLCILSFLCIIIFVFSNKDMTQILEDQVQAPGGNETLLVQFTDKPKVLAHTIFSWEKVPIKTISNKNNYEIESFVTRDLDIPLIGTMNDVKQLGIDDALDIIENGKVGSFFMLNFTNKLNRFRT
mgnify:CR=1 FL=1